MSAGVDDGLEGAGNEALTQMRATRFGEYGRQINELYMSVELDGVLGSWEDAQNYAAEHFNITAPEGYDEIKDKTCYRAVFEIAWQSGYIDAAQLAYLSSEDFRTRTLKRYYPSAAAARRDLITGPFRYHAGYNLYWFFRRKSPDEPADLFGPTAHVMYALDGVNAAGSNNYVKAGVPYRYFATHDLSLVGPSWLPSPGVWVLPEEKVYLDIVRTPLKVLRESEK
jgi:hypothetical protein